MVATTMKAVFLDQKASKVSLETTAVPVPRDNEVLIKVVYAGVCGSDLKMIEGKHPFSDGPLVLGHEFCGTVEKVGKNVSHVKRGDRVAVDPQRGCKACRTCTSGRYTQCDMNKTRNAVGVFVNGGFANFSSIPEEQVFKVPDSVPFEQAVLAEPLSCVAHGYDRLGHVAIGTSILIIGGGIIGTLWTCVLHLQGHKKVIVSEPVEARRKTINSLETNFEVISPSDLTKRKENDPEWGVDLIIDCSGYGPALEQALTLLNTGGRLLLFGISGPDVKVTFCPYELFFKELTVLASFVNTFAYNKSLDLIESMGKRFTAPQNMDFFWVAQSTDNGYVGAVTILLRYLDFNKLGVQVFPLEKYDEAFKTLKRGSISKAIFNIGE